MRHTRVYVQALRQTHTQTNTLTHTHTGDGSQSRGSSTSELDNMDLSQPNSGPNSLGRASSGGPLSTMGNLVSLAQVRGVLCVRVCVCECAFARRACLS